MKVLICLSSLIRGFDAFLSSFRRMVIGRLPTRPDLVGHFATPIRHDVYQLEKDCNHCNIQFEEDPSINLNLQYLSRSMASQRNGILGNILQWNSLKKCEELKREAEAIYGPYDVVIWSRPDLYFLTAIDELFDVEADSIYMPVHDTWGGVNDRFCFGSGDVVGRRMLILDYFLKVWHPNLVSGAISLEDRGGTWNPESVLADMLRSEIQCRIKASQVVVSKIRERPQGVFLVRPVIGRSRIHLDQRGSQLIDDAINLFNELARAPVERNEGRYALGDVQRAQGNISSPKADQRR